MSWNHRVLAHQQGDEIWLEIHEVYYDNNGKPTSYTSKRTPLSVGGESIKSIRWTLNKMKECLDKHIIWAGDRFPERLDVELQEKLFKFS